MTGSLCETFRGEISDRHFYKARRDSERGTMLELYKWEEKGRITYINSINRPSSNSLLLWFCLVGRMWFELGGLC
jgi:hypothetical protein